MDAKRRYLVVMDVPAIMEYVFGTDRLVEIRGASARLDSLNRARARECLEENLGKENVECIYANGGGVQFILDGSRHAGMTHVSSDTCLRGPVRSIIRLG